MWPWSYLLFHGNHSLVLVFLHALTEALSLLKLLLNLLALLFRSLQTRLHRHLGLSGHLMQGEKENERRTKREKKMSGVKRGLRFLGSLVNSTGLCWSVVSALHFADLLLLLQGLLQTQAHDAVLLPAGRAGLQPLLQLLHLSLSLAQTPSQLLQLHLDT